jgi:hypothetical protein
MHDNVAVNPSTSTMMTSIPKKNDDVNYVAINNYFEKGAAVNLGSALNIGSNGNDKFPTYFCVSHKPFKNSGQ